MRDVGLAVRSGYRMRPDPSRVVSMLFIPGMELVGGSEARTSGAVARVLDLDEAEVEANMAELLTRFGARHDGLEEVFERHADRVSAHVTSPLSDVRRQFLGAVFTHEYSLEGASICNPSLVAHPDQDGVAPGGLRVIMSYRSIGEGHISSICFRTGEIDGAGVLAMHEPQPFPVVGTKFGGVLLRDVVHAKLRDTGLDGETAAYLLDNVDPVFTYDDLESVVAQLAMRGDTRFNIAETAVNLRSISECFYVADFDAATDVSQRVLWPATPCESHGLEDARFVRLEGNADTAYVASYTAFNGAPVSQQLLATNDFLSFASTPLTGLGANNKGLAIFPRQVGGRYVALSRHDRESNALAFSSDLYVWNEVQTTQTPRHPWEVLQLGNCGSPIELDEGWLVITHGVGPMRTYGIGAILLDLEDPARIIAQLPRPLLLPNDEEQDGYVPNVVYSCGSIVHDDTLYMPYGIADQFISHATVPVRELLDAMVRQ